MPPAMPHAVITTSFDVLAFTPLRYCTIASLTLNHEKSMDRVKKEIRKAMFFSHASGRNICNGARAIEPIHTVIVMMDERMCVLRSVSTVMFRSTESKREAVQCSACAPYTSMVSLNAMSVLPNQLIKSCVKTLSLLAPTNSVRRAKSEMPNPPELRRAQTG
ncbi:unnamed protein product [Trypanosoma congolense IL3000]|uniref:WGS project CAEQ00000000 data, annotated contig 1982 n=1 Tax=Trypanosoma congolense (strain IL3000) TaxID=1068625 RepID=F9WAK8_TRYCI|nr:unnamed protein product [Trypanosoma congolense IL3000]